MSLIFLDSYYFYSWIRLYKYNIPSLVKRYNPSVLLVVENIQLPKLRSMKRLHDKVIRISSNNTLMEYLKHIAAKRRPQINFLDLVDNGIIGEEDVSILEYLLIVNEKTGKIDESEVKPGFKIKAKRKRLKDIIHRGAESVAPLYSEQYVNYILKKIMKIIKVDRLEMVKFCNTLHFQQQPFQKMLVEIESKLCNITECPKVRNSETIRQHKEDLQLALTITSYAIEKNISIIAIGIPLQTFECFNHVLNYLRENNSKLRSLLIHPTWS